MDAKLEISKIKGDENPSDLMIKILGLKEIMERLAEMSIQMNLCKGIEGISE